MPARLHRKLARRGMRFPYDGCKICGSEEAAVLQHAVVGFYDAADSVHGWIVRVAVEWVVVRDGTSCDARTKSPRGELPAHAFILGSHLQQALHTNQPSMDGAAVVVVWEIAPFAAHVPNTHAVTCLRIASVEYLLLFVATFGGRQQKHNALCLAQISLRDHAIYGDPKTLCGVPSWA
jgi:hypothetical protein